MNVIASLVAARPKTAEAANELTALVSARCHELERDGRLSWLESAYTLAGMAVRMACDSGTKLPDWLEVQRFLWSAIPLVAKRDRAS